MSEEKKIVKEYVNGEIAIIWKPDLCVHAKYCWQELPEVFDPNKRPWVNAQGASTERIIKQVDRCPSGALSFRWLDEAKAKEKKLIGAVKATYIKGHPLIVEGDLTVVLPDGRTEKKSGTTAFCRCGKSKSQPYCDGTHEALGFNN